MKKEINFIDGLYWNKYSFKKRMENTIQKIKFKGDYYFSSSKSLGV